MSNIIAAPSVPAPAPVSKKKLFVIFGIWGVLALAGLAGVTAIALQQQQRDLVQWQRQIQLAADAKGASVEQWLSEQQAVINGLAGNTSLQLYLGELSGSDTAGNPESAMDETLALTTYLHNLIAVEAEQKGFFEPVVAPEVKANVPQPQGAGLAIVTAEWKPVTAAGNFPVLDTLAPEVTDTLRAGNPSPLGPITIEQNGAAYMLFYAPIVNVQMDSGTAPVGYVLGMRKLDKAFTALFSPSLQSEKTTETLLVSKKGENIEYMTALQDGTKPMTLTMNADATRLAEAYAFANPGTFALKKDYRGKQVLFSSHPVKNTPWMVIHKVDESAAMAASASFLTWLTACYVLFIALVTMTLIAIWRHASAAHNRHNSDYYRQLASTIERQQNLLSLITTSTPNGIVIVDPSMHYRYVNKAAATDAGHDPKYMMGKTLHEVLGSHVASSYASMATRAYESQRIEKTVQEFSDAGQQRTVQSIFVPLQDIPLPDRTENGPGILIVDRDITDYARERKRHEATLDQLVDTLVELVDSRDPYAQHHSNGVCLVAKAIAEQMDLDPTLQTACAEAGKLMNVGKIRAPETLLTQQKISTSEKQNISRAMHASADILRNIAFEGPVVETLEQAYEHVDGSGPSGMKEAEILPSAQIIAVANAFIALISPRAYRDANSIEEALDALRATVGTSYSRKVFATLEYFIENGGGREMLQHWQKQQQRHMKKPA